MNWKTIIRYIFTVFLFFAVLFGFMIAKNFQQERILEEELLEIENLANQTYFNDILFQRKLNRYVTTGYYRVVEQAIKTYYIDVYQCYSEMNDIMNDQNIVSLVSTENYRSDGPEFVKSFQYINEKKDRLKELKELDKILFTRDYIMSYITDKDLDDYYVNYYEELMIDVLNLEISSDIQSYLDYTIDILDKIGNILNFLAENKDDWSLVYENIYFNTEELEKEYIRLISLLIYDEGSVSL